MHFALLVLTACVDRPATEPLPPVQTSSSPETTPTTPLPWQVAVDPHQFKVHVARVVVTGGPPGGETTLDLTCTAAEDPEEVIAAEVAAGPDAPVSELVGLLADTEYVCDAVPHDGSPLASTSFHTASLGIGMPTWSLEHDGSSTPRHILMNNGGRNGASPKLLLIDPDGRLRWHIHTGGNPADLDASFVAPDTILYGGGYATAPTLVDLFQRRLYTGPQPIEGAVAYHHHVEALDDGTIATMQQVHDTDGTNIWSATAIVMIDPTSNLPVWTWRTQTAVDQGVLPPGHPHANWMGLYEDPLGTGLWVNFRQIHRVLRLDRGTGEVTLSIGVGQDYALLDADGQPLPDEEWFYGAHGLDLVDDVLWLYDNGWGRPDGSEQSRALALELDHDQRTARKVWSFTEPDWYEPIWGDVDPLPDGDVLIARGHCTDCGRPEGRSQVLVVSPEGHVRWRLVFGSILDGLYRAEAIEPCAILPQVARYCRG